MASRVPANAGRRKALFQIQDGSVSGRCLQAEEQRILLMFLPVLPRTMQKMHDRYAEILLEKGQNGSAKV